MKFEINNQRFTDFHKKVARKQDQLLNNPKYFLSFCISIILFILVFYSFTKNAIFPTIILGGLWLAFWSRSTMVGKSYLLIATSLGYAHEILGVAMGWFTYATGNFGLGVPVWVAIGYGCIYWSIENFWTHAEEKHYFPQKHFRFIWVGSFLSLFIIDYFLLEISDKFIFNTLFIILLLFLFNTLEEQHLALTVAFFCGTVELTGSLLGAWYHPTLSLVRVIPVYIFFVWLIQLGIQLTHKGRMLRLRDMLFLVTMPLLWVITFFIF